MKELPKQGTLPLSEEFMCDIYWWLKFMPNYNGVNFIPILQFTEAGSFLVTDECLTGCGGFNYVHGECFHAQFPQSVLEEYLHI